MAWMVRLKPAALASSPRSNSSSGSIAATPNSDRRGRAGACAPCGCRAPPSAKNLTPPMRSQRVAQPASQAESPAHGRDCTPGVLHHPQSDLILRPQRLVGAQRRGHPCCRWRCGTPRCPSPICRDRRFDRGHGFCEFRFRDGFVCQAHRVLAQHAGRLPVCASRSITPPGTSAVAAVYQPGAAPRCSARWSAVSLLSIRHGNVGRDCVQQRAVRPHAIGPHARVPARASDPRRWSVSLDPHTRAHHFGHCMRR